MNDATPRRLRGSLLERAAEVYEFKPKAASLADAVAEAPLAMPAPAPAAERPRMRHRAPVERRQAAIDRVLLAEQGMIVPGAPIGVLAEEFRLIKRQLLLTARRVAEKTGSNAARMVLVGSADPGDGKTWSAINLALSMAAERDTEVLLVDADFAKPDLMATLGLPDGPGLLDVLADPALDVERCIVETDVPQLTLLPSGRKSNDDTELLASDRTRALLDELLDANPHRVIIFDTPPALAASPASVLALHVGQVMLVVRADRTSEASVRQAVELLDGCEQIQLVLNAVSLTTGKSRFGSYYGQEDTK